MKSTREKQMIWGLIFRNRPSSIYVFFIFSEGNPYHQDTIPPTTLKFAQVRTEVIFIHLFLLERSGQKYVYIHFEICMFFQSCQGFLLKKTANLRETIMFLKHFTTSLQNELPLNPPLMTNTYANFKENCENSLKLTPKLLFGNFYKILFFMH